MADRHFVVQLAFCVPTTPRLRRRARRVVVGVGILVLALFGSSVSLWTFGQILWSLACGCGALGLSFGLVTARGGRGYLRQLRDLCALITGLVPVDQGLAISEFAAGMRSIARFSVQVEEHKTEPHYAGIEWGES